MSGTLGLCGWVIHIRALGVSAMLWLEMKLLSVIMNYYHTGASSSDCSKHRQAELPSPLFYGGNSMLSKWTRFLLTLWETWLARSKWEDGVWGCGVNRTVLDECSFSSLCILCAWLLDPHWEINGVFVIWNWYSTMRNILVLATVSFHSDTQNFAKTCQLNKKKFKEWTNTIRVFVAWLQSNMESLCIGLHWIAHRAQWCYCVHFMGI